MAFLYAPVDKRTSCRIFRCDGGIGSVPMCGIFNLNKITFKKVYGESTAKQRKSRCEKKDRKG